MKIFINGEPVSFSLENEKTLFDVFGAISGWAADQGIRISCFEVDGEPIHIPPIGTWAGRPLEDILTIAVSAEQDKPAEDIHDLEVIRDYFDLFEKALAADDEKALGEILKEYPYIRQALEVHIKDIFGSAAFDKDAFFSSGRDPASFTPAEKTAMKSYVQAAGLVVRDRLAEITQPAQEAANVSRLLLAVKPSLENVPVLLQSGKDREAMQSILTYTELALKAIRILSRKHGGQEARAVFCRELNGILNELTSAFQARDSVLIGDLFEYEIAPRTDRLAELLMGECP
ncbi:MAG: hypothetical protein LBK13_06160 [Spirochaetales bacterium]|jgi:hypothetical protein|nr:hypothetical protein [Spirochaetales bacterium]